MILDLDGKKTENQHQLEAVENNPKY